MGRQQIALLRGTPSRLIAAGVALTLLAACGQSSTKVSTEAPDSASSAAEQLGRATSTSVWARSKHRVLAPSSHEIATSSAAIGGVARSASSKHPRTNPQPPPPSTAPPVTPAPPPVTSPAPPVSSSPPPAPVAPGRWHPAVGTTWQYQLDGTVDLSVGAQAYDVDGFDTPATGTGSVAAIHAAGAHAICYVETAWEDYRSDAGSFSPALLGRSMGGYPHERWVDVRNLGALLPVMTARARMCASKGFDAIEWDNVDSYTQNTGFPLSEHDAEVFATDLASITHDLGLAVGLKNSTDNDMDVALQPAFDFAVDEQCNQYGECGSLSAFISAGKPVFNVEYELSTGDFCAADRARGFSGIARTADLTARPYARC